MGNHRTGHPRDRASESRKQCAKGPSRPMRCSIRARARAAIFWGGCTCPSSISATRSWRPSAPRPHACGPRPRSSCASASAVRIWAPGGAGGAERSVPAAAPHAGGSRDGLRGPEPLGGLRLRAARRAGGAFVRRDRDLEIGHHDRTGHRIPRAQGRTRTALRPRRGRRTHRRRHRPRARRAAHPGRRGGLSDFRHSGRRGEAASRC